MTRKRKPDLAERVARKIVRVRQSMGHESVFLFGHFICRFQYGRFQPDYKGGAKLARDRWIIDIAHRLWQAGVKGR